jgi:dolichol-phosphate mannosyltransferase
MRVLVAIPTYNEEKYVLRVLQRVRRYARHVLVIDDGSTDGTPCLLPSEPVEVIRHAENRGYGRSIQDAFRWGCVDAFDWVITMDCDEQHEPEAIPAFMEAIASDRWDVISGSRYLRDYGDNDSPPPARRRINAEMTALVNRRLGLSITDAFCGFKAYRVCTVARLPWDVDGYAFPMQFWVRALAHRLRLTEVPVRLIYNDPTRTFGGPLDQDDVRKRHYLDVFEREIERCADMLPACARRPAGCGTP